MKSPKFEIWKPQPYRIPKGYFKPYYKESMPPNSPFPYINSLHLSRFLGSIKFGINMDKDWKFIMRIKTLVDLYTDSLDFRNLEINSQILYQRMISTFYLYVPQSKELKDIDTIFVDALYPLIIKGHSQHRANSVAKIMSIIWNKGIRHKLVDSNPWAKMKLVALKPRTNLWTKDQVKQFITNASIAGYNETALLIQMCYDCAQRPRDILNLKWVDINYKSKYATIFQQKTKTTVMVPLPETLYKKLFHLSPLNSIGNDAILNRHIFTTITLQNYHTSFRNALKRTGLPSHLQIRDLRRTALTELADAGATDSEIRAISGHTGRSDILARVYVQKTEEQARRAQNKRLHGIEGIDDDPGMWHEDGKI